MNETRSRIAVVAGADGARIQELLAGMVAGWRAAGVRVVGVLAEPHNLPDRTCSAGNLRDIASGQLRSMYLEEAPSHTSCHLDASGVEAACAALLDQVPRSDLVVLSKFGKLEAAGGGLAAAFKTAIAADRPVLTTVSQKHLAAWHGVAPDAVTLPADGPAIEAWWRSSRSVSRRGSAP